MIEDMESNQKIVSDNPLSGWSYDERIYLENLIGVYITGNMLQNYIMASKKQIKLTPKDEKYLQNKLVDTFNTLAKLLAPVNRFLINTGAFCQLESKYKCFMISLMMCMA